MYDKTNTQQYVMAKWLPKLNGGGQPMRSSTMKNVDILFNALSCLIGLMTPAFKTSLLTAVSITYQRIQGLILSDPGKAIGDLKHASKVYLEYIRNPADESNIPNFGISGFSEANFADLESVTEALKQFPILANIVTLRKILYGTHHHEGLLFFDQIVFALLSLHRVIVLPPKYDFSTITSKSDFINDDITDGELTLALSRLGFTSTSFKAILSEKSTSQKHFISPSAGPNGKATWTAFSDALALLNNLGVWKAFSTYAEKTGLVRFVRDLVSVSAVPSADPVVGTPVKSGKIHTFEEWGGKTRNVAVVDYWTQLILTPLHDTIFEMLKKVSTDATFDQNAACTAIKSWTANPDSVLYSFDLTAATDRLPVELQVRILTHLFADGAIAQAWADMLTKRGYMTVEGEEIYYAAGLPMGSKSNWAMLALTHHVIIQVASIRAKDSTTWEQLSGIAPLKGTIADGPYPYHECYSAYRVCGDDSVLHGTNVAVKYQAIMAQFGLTINEFKSVLPSTNKLSAAEFCKRIFVDGSELTSIPVKLVVKTAMNGRLAPQLQSTALLRCLDIKDGGLLDWISALVDRESYSFLVLLNLLPKSVTGLFGVVKVPATAPSLTTLLSDTVKLDDKKIAQGYTYTAAVDELKRLDALLRVTDAVAEGIKQHLLGYDQLDLSDVAWAGEDTNINIIESLKKMRHEIGYSHPVVQAAQAETTRVVNLLAQLAAGNEDVSTMARLRLLDSFRNALVTLGSDPDAARAQADRTLVQKTLTNAAELVAKQTLYTNTNVATTPSLSFTTMISYLSRLWTVRWEFGNVVTINTVRSKVISDANTAIANASRYASDITFVKSLKHIVATKSTRTSS